MNKVIIVDDESIVRLAINSMVDWEKFGFEVVGTASDGTSALKIIENKNPDFIITDLKMPNMDGIQLIKELKNRQFQGEIVVLSNYNDFMLVKEAMKLGIHDYILKITVKSEDFVNLLKEVGEKLSLSKANKKNAIYNYNQDKNKLELRIVESLLEPKNIRNKNIQDIFLNAKAKLYFSFTPEWENKNRLQREDISTEKVLKDVFNDLYKDAEIIEINKTESEKEFLILVVYKDQELNSSGFIQVGKLSERIKMYYDLQCYFCDTEVILSEEQFKKQYGELLRKKKLMFYHGFRGKIDIEVLKYEESEALFNGKVISLIKNIEDKKQQVHLSNYKSMAEKVIGEAAVLNIKPSLLKKNIIKLMAMVEKFIYQHYDTISLDSEDFSFYDEHIRNSSTEEELFHYVIAYFTRLEELMVKVKYRREVVEVFQYIHENICTKITVSTIAEKIRISEAYLCKIFKEETGDTIINYMNKLKMKKAYELLQNSDLYIKEIASRVGIEDPFYFNRLFKKYYGNTPKDIRTERNNKS